MEPRCWTKSSPTIRPGCAYLLGFILAELSVLLVVRNPQVSPWFPLVLLIYPVFETFFSIYRRKFMQGFSAMQPDNMHLHQLIHDKIVPRKTRSGTDLNGLDTNNHVAKYLWLQAIVTATTTCPCATNSSDKSLICTAAEVKAKGKT